MLAASWRPVMVALPDTAIRTAYRGTTFRSRLEARWVVFFDEMGIAWTYQREGFALDGERVPPNSGCQPTAASGTSRCPRR